MRGVPRLLVTRAPWEWVKTRHAEDMWALPPMAPLLNHVLWLLRRGRSLRIPQAGAAVPWVQCWLWVRLHRVPLWAVAVAVVVVASTHPTAEGAGQLSSC